MTTAITAKAPKPIPALNIPAMASQELNKNDIKNRVDAVIKFDFFIVKN